MPSLRSLPRSLLFFLAAAIVFALQAFPWTGIFMMFLLAPLWNGALILVGLAALTLEAATGATSRRWLVVPLVCAVGYGGAAWRSRAEADALIAAFAHVNNGKTIAFDPAKQSLVVEGRNGEGIGALLVDWDLPAYWTLDPRDRTAPAVLHRLAVGDVCERIRTDRGLAAANIRAFGVHERRSGRSVFLKGVCTVTMTAAVPAPPVTMSIGLRRLDRKDPSKHWTQTIVLRSGDREIELQLGGITPLPWLPYPLLGCALNSGAPSWDCFAWFRRDRERRFGAISAEAAIVAALGLTPAPASTRLERIAADLLPDFAPLVEARETKALAALDAALVDPRIRLTVHDIAGLAAHPQVWADRGSAIVATIERRLAEPKASRETPRNLAGLLADAPADRLAEILPDLLAIWGRMPAGTLDTDVIPAAMTKRLVGFGAPALPIVERLAFDRPRPWIAEPMRALCRLAPLSARDVDAIAARMRATDRRRDEFVGAVLALLRLGRRDLVEPILAAEIAEEDRKREERRTSTTARLLEALPGRAGDRAQMVAAAVSPRQKKFRTWLDTVGPESPPEVCDGK